MIPRINFEHESRSLGETLKCEFTPRPGGNEDLLLRRESGESVSLEALPSAEQNFLLAQSLALNDQWCDDHGVFEPYASEEE